MGFVLSTCAWKSVTLEVHGGLGFVIAMHPVETVIAGRPQINLSGSTVPQVLHSLDACSLVSLRNDFKLWEVTPSVQYSLPDLNADKAEVMQGVTHLITAKALPDGEPVP